MTRLIEIEARLTEARKRSDETLRHLPEGWLLSRAEHDRQRLVKDLDALLAALNVEEMARVLYQEGAWCGVCEYEGWDACDGCRETVRTYAQALRTAILGES